MLGFADGSFINKYPDKCNGVDHAWKYDTPYYRTCECGIQEAYFYNESKWKDVTEK